MKQILIVFSILSISLSTGIQAMSGDDDYSSLREEFYKNNDPRELSLLERVKKMEACSKDTKKDGCDQLFFFIAEKNEEMETHLSRNEDDSIRFSIEEKKLKNKLCNDLSFDKDMENSTEQKKEQELNVKVALKSVLEKAKNYSLSICKGVKKEFVESPKLFIGTAAIFTILEVIRGGR